MAIESNAERTKRRLLAIGLSRAEVPHPSGELGHLPQTRMRGTDRVPLIHDYSPLTRSRIPVPTAAGRLSGTDETPTTSRSRRPPGRESNPVHHLRQWQVANPDPGGQGRNGRRCLVGDPKVAEPASGGTPEPERPTLVARRTVDSRPAKEGVESPYLRYAQST